MILLSFAALLACHHLGYAMPCFPHEQLKMPPVSRKRDLSTYPAKIASEEALCVGKYNRGMLGC
jgi:hypothetical protein